MKDMNEQSFLDKVSGIGEPARFSRAQAPTPYPKERLDRYTLLGGLLMALAFESVVVGYAGFGIFLAIFTLLFSMVALPLVVRRPLEPQRFKIEERLAPVSKTDFTSLLSRRSEFTAVDRSIVWRQNVRAPKAQFSSSLQPQMIRPFR